MGRSIDYISCLFGFVPSLLNFPAVPLTSPTGSDDLGCVLSKRRCVVAKALALARGSWWVAGRRAARTMGVREAIMFASFSWSCFLVFLVICESKTSGLMLGVLVWFTFAFAYHKTGVVFVAAGKCHLAATPLT